MPTIEDLTVSLHELITKESVLFCSWHPNDFDSTTFAKLAIKLTISSLDGRSVNFNLNTENTLIVLKLFENLNKTKATPLLGHNWKDLFTFFARVTKKELILKNIFDLYWYESYIKHDTSVGDKTLMKIRFKEWLKNARLLDIYKKIYQPLICHTLPVIENFPLLNEDLGQLVFPNYYVEGQENGRLSCSCEKKRCYNPHSLGSEKSFLKLHNYGEVIFQFDYRNMEVSVLAHLSKDDNLLQIVQKKDVYETIFYMVTGLKDHSEARILGKKMFLPIIYGQSPSGLSKSFAISLEQAVIYCEKVKSLFPKVFDYVEDFQLAAKKEGHVQDCFGRIRSIQENEAYKARNFCIQSPSALICLESLVRLDRGSESLYKLAFHVHDGYFIACKTKDMQEAYYRAKTILENRSEFMPDLNLLVATRVGKSLEKMVLLNTKVKN